MSFHPRGYAPGTTQTRFAATTPSSFNASTRSVDATLSMGSPVTRPFGTEVLRIAPGAVVLDRLTSSGIPLLDSHQQYGISNALGRVAKVWFSKGALMGTLVFNQTEQGERAMGMIERGELAGISCGYTIREWEISDSEGNVIDPEKTRIDFSDDLTFEAVRWELLEASLVTMAADSAAMVRSMGAPGIGAAKAAKMRMVMRTRHQMHDRMSDRD